MSESRKDSESAGQVLRFLVVGVWNTAFGYGTFALITYFLTDRLSHAYLIGNLIASVMSVLMAYLGHKFVVFRTRGNYLRECLRYYMVYGFSILLGLVTLPVTIALLGLFIHEAQWLPYIAQALLMPFGALLSFFGHSRFSFAEAVGARKPSA